MSNYYVFYDTETTGTSPKFDQILQFAAILTDEEFNELDHIDVRCRLLPYMVPAPGAMKVTGVTPEMLGDAPLSYYEMARFVHDALSKWAPACFAGFNIIQFDEEAIRHMFWQNLLDPYITTGRGSSRLDLLKLCEVANAAQPGIIKTALTEKGNVSFKLDRIAPLNGFENHNAHDALGDVRATIFMAKILKERAPELFRHQIEMGDAKLAGKLVEDNRMLHYLTHFGQAKLYEAGVVTRQPSNPKSALFFDLSCDPTPYLGLAPEVLAEQIADTKTPLKVVRLNAQPAIYEPGTSPFTPDVPLETEAMVRRLELIQEAGFVKRAGEAMEIRAKSFGENQWLEDRIYEGFPSWDDKNLMPLFHRGDDWAEKRRISGTFQDERLRLLAKRIVYVEGRAAMPDAEALAMEAAIIRNRMLNENDVPWNTLSRALDEAEKMDETPELVAIQKWLETTEEKSRARLAEIEGLVGYSVNAQSEEADGETAETAA